ncbi:MAG: NUDIX domain-containing protein [Candidatus Paceibacterota bacterium]
MDKQKPKVAVNIFVIKDNKLLLGKRRSTAGDGSWGLPGGKLEFMEHLIAGAKRELEEETSLIADLAFENIVNDPCDVDSTHFLHINFLANNIIGEPKLMEPNKCYEWKYFSLDDLPEPIFIGHKKIIPAFIEKTVFID